MNVPIDKLLEEIGRLHVANAVLTEQLAKARQVLQQQADQLAADSPGEPPDEAVPD
ncbi:MAG: hypothetical protein KAU28_02530 [Phycisphaerae bacterium]|nr:hypothetical protein [Phycisphaerae bacterium]